MPSKGKNPEKKRERDRKYRTTHPEKHRETNRHYRETHREEVREHARRYYAKHREERCEYNRKYMRRLRLGIYGLTLAEYSTMLATQGGVCAICGVPPSGRRLGVDHDHVTGKVRGLLCGNCNRMLGSAHDNPASLQKAIDYLNASPRRLLDAETVASPGVD